MPNNIKARRIAADRSQQEMAELLGTSRQAFQVIEYGEREPGVTFGIRMAEILGVDITDLYTKEALMVGEESRKWVNETSKKAQGEMRKRNKK